MSNVLVEKLFYIVSKFGKTTIRGSIVYCYHVLHSLNLSRVEMLLKEHFGAIKASAPNCGVTG